MTFDTLIHNGTLVTVNSDFEIIENGVIGIADGRIALIKKQAADSPLPEAGQVIDASGGIVMPGLVNTHTHLPMTLFRGLADDLPLHVWLNEHMFPAEAAHIKPETVRVGSLLACAEMLLSGTTTCCDGYFYEDVVAQAVQMSGMRAVLGQGVIDFPAPGVPDSSKNVEHGARFAEKWKGVSSLITPSIFCHSPYTCSKETLVRAKAAATDLGALFQIHVAETRSELDQIQSEHQVSPIGYLERLGILDPRTLLVHTIWVDGAEMEMIAHHQTPVSVTTESEMKLASGIAPIPEFLKAGIAVGLGTDGCASNNDLDMFQEMDMTAKLQKVRTQDPTVMDARSVLTLATLGGANTLGLGKEVGSLEKGKQADIIILDAHQPHLVPMYSPASHVVYTACGSDVRDVLVAGKLLVTNRQLFTLDVDTILTQATSLGEAIQTTNSTGKA